MAEDALTLNGKPNVQIDAKLRAMQQIIAIKLKQPKLTF